MATSSRRDFLSVSLLGVGAASVGLLALSKYASGKMNSSIREALGPLRPVRDENTGLPLLRLPEGYRYRSFSWAGTKLHDGHPVPALADGMGVVHSEGSRITLIRNHELRGSSGAIGDPATAYDVTGGGTTTLVYDTAEESLKDSWISLGGTLMNCAGGVTPWGAWLSCEEAPLSPELFHIRTPLRKTGWKADKAKKPHGFVFEVPAEGVAQPEPIVDMGQFYHEAVAFDPRSGIAYMTEDTNPRAGLYRYIPKVPGQMLAGGQLQMMRVDGGRDMRDGLVIGRELPVEWVDIPDPTRGFTENSREGDGVVKQGLEAGGSGFISLEGCAFMDGHLYFTSKYGGRAKSGYVFEYDIDREIMWLIFDSPGQHVFSGPDNIIMSPRGSLVLCEDRVSQDPKAQYMAGLTAEGDFFRFAQINARRQAACAEGRCAALHDRPIFTRDSRALGFSWQVDGSQHVGSPQDRSAYGRNDCLQLSGKR